MHAERSRGRPLVVEVVAVENPAGSLDSVHFTLTPVLEMRGRALRWTGLVLARLEASFARAGLDLRQLLERCAA